MNNNLISKAHAFLKDYLDAHEKISEYARNYRYEHCVRVYNIACELCEHEKFDETVLKLAALLHDVGKFDVQTEADHGKMSAQIARIFLNECKAEDDLINMVCECIEAHVDDNSNLKEAKALQDCDDLDHLGACRIAETMLIELQMNQSLVLMEENTLKRIQLIKEEMQNECGCCKTSKKLFQQRFEVVLHFNEQLLEQIQQSKF